MYNIDRAIDVNVNGQKTPLILLCEESERLSYLNLYKEYDGGAPIIKGTKDLDLDNFTFEYEIKIKDTNNVLREVNVDANLGVITDADMYND